MLRARFDPPELIGCPCVDCGERDMVLTAGVYDDEEPFAMVLAIFRRPGGDHAASFRVTLAEPSPDGPAPRETFAFKLRCDANISFVDNPDGDFPADAEGPAVHCLTRAEAFEHPRRLEAFAVLACTLKAAEFRRHLAARPGLH